jgi:deoxyribodipyrimidine photo-lyase
MAVPKQLQERDNTELFTVLPSTQMPQINESMPVLIYNSYNLDPSWRRSEDANRILLLEPSHFEKYPVSGKVIDFILSLCKNIEGIKIFCGEMKELLAAYPEAEIIYKEHPAFEYGIGLKDSRDWMFPQVEGYYPSFFSYWKKCEKYLSS